MEITKALFYFSTETELIWEHLRDQEWFKSLASAEISKNTDGEKGKIASDSSR